MAGTSATKVDPWPSRAPSPTTSPVLLRGGARYRPWRHGFRRRSRAGRLTTCPPCFSRSKHRAAPICARPSARSTAPRWQWPGAAARRCSRFSPTTVSAGAMSPWCSTSPAQKSVALAAALAPCFDPVFVLDNWPHPDGVVPAHLTLGAALYFLPSFERARSTRSPTAPPLFVLDRQRLAPYTDDAGLFDNRYFAGLPSREALQSAGIRQLLYVTPDEVSMDADDLNGDLVALDEGGIDVKMLALSDFSQTPLPGWPTAPVPGCPSTPLSFGHQPPVLFRWLTGVARVLPLVVRLAPAFAPGERRALGSLHPSAARTEVPVPSPRRGRSCLWPRARAAQAAGARSRAAASGAAARSGARTGASEREAAMIGGILRPPLRQPRAVPRRRGVGRARRRDLARPHRSRGRIHRRQPQVDGDRPRSSFEAIPTSTTARSSAA